jgi:hypothetical protein
VTDPPEVIRKRFIIGKVGPLNPSEPATMEYADIIGSNREGDYLFLVKEGDVEFIVNLRHARWVSARTEP